MILVDCLKESLKKRPGARSSENLAALLPWYLNGTLSPSESRTIARWLRKSHGALPDVGAPRQTDLATWREVQRSVRSQPAAFPNPGVWRRIASEISHSPCRPLARIGTRLALGTCLALLLLALFWTILQPGVLLEWSARGGTVVAFRIYRAPLGTTDYSFVGQIPADPRPGRYHYVDAKLWPGQRFVYRIDVVGAGGRLAACRILSGNSLVALPAQMAVGAVSLVIGYGVVTLSGPGPGLGRTRGQFA
jgi:hypothetical protein